MVPACLSLMCSFTRGNTEGTNPSKMYVCVCMFVLCLFGVGFVAIYQKF